MDAAKHTSHKKTLNVVSRVSRKEKHLPVEAKEIYDEAVSVLKEMGTYHDSDKSLIELYAYNLYKWRKCTSELEEMGFMVKGQKGNLVKNPLFTLQKQFQDAFMTVANALGIGTLGRTKIKWVEPSKGDDDPTDPMNLE